LGLHPTGGIWIAFPPLGALSFFGRCGFPGAPGIPGAEGSCCVLPRLTLSNIRATAGVVTGPAVSPENTFLHAVRVIHAKKCMGPTCDSVLVRDLFHVLHRSIAHSSESTTKFRAQLEAAAEEASTAPNWVGTASCRSGLEDYEEARPEPPSHVAPSSRSIASSQISPATLQHWPRQRAVSIERRIRRGDWEDVEWSRANLINYFARLRVPKAAHDEMLGLLREATETNLAHVLAERGGGCSSRHFCR